MPDGGRFNFGTGLNISLGEANGIGSQSRPLVLVDPLPNGTVPDGGMTAMLLGASLAGLRCVRRKF
jgi:hypothetical protein